MENFKEMIRRIALTPEKAEAEIIETLAEQVVTHVKNDIQEKAKTGKFERSKNGCRVTGTFQIWHSSQKGFYIANMRCSEKRGPLYNLIHPKGDYITDAGCCVSPIYFRPISVSDSANNAEGEVCITDQEKRLRKRLNALSAIDGITIKGLLCVTHYQKTEDQDRYNIVYQEISDKEKTTFCKSKNNNC